MILRILRSNAIIFQIKENWASNYFMTKAEILEKFKSKIESKSFHWLSYHFVAYDSGLKHLLVEAIINCCDRIENFIPGFSEDFSKKLASFSGRDKYTPHYEQIIQALSELLIINHLCTKFPPEAHIEQEPICGNSQKNPEIGIFYQEKELYVEVKCPTNISHSTQRAEARIEIPARMSHVRCCASQLLEEGESLVSPRDNVVKDFLESSNQKFKSFKEVNPDCITILAIVWDNHPYEAISALRSMESGLLTENSYHTNQENNPIKFENIDAIVLISQSHQIIEATKVNASSTVDFNPLNWNSEIIPKAFIPINCSEESKEYICEKFEAHDPSTLEMFAEFNPHDMVLNIDRTS